MCLPIIIMDPKFDITKNNNMNTEELLLKFNEAKKQNKKFYDDVGNTIEVYEIKF